MSAGLFRRNGLPEFIGGIVRFIRNAIGTTTTVAIALENDADAATGAQQYSPGLLQRARGWKTNATAASQPVDFASEARAVQGAAAPSGVWALQARVNEGAWGDALTVSSSGAIVASSSISSGGNVVLPSGGLLYFGARSVSSSPADGTTRHANNAGSAYMDVVVSTTGGAAIASHAISLAQDATTKVGVAPVGILTVVNTTDGEVAQFSVIGTGAVAELSDSSGNFTVTKDNMATINVYYNTDGVYVQNKIAATKSVRLILQGV